MEYRRVSLPQGDVSIVWESKTGSDFPYLKEVREVAAKEFPGVPDDRIRVTGTTNRKGYVLALLVQTDD
jgi:hypothetical protein